MADNAFPAEPAPWRLIEDTLPELAVCEGVAEIADGWERLNNAVQTRLKTMQEELPKAAQEGRLDDVAAGVRYLHDIRVLQNRGFVFASLYPEGQRAERKANPKDFAKFSDTFFESSRSSIDALHEVQNALSDALTVEAQGQLLAENPDLKPMEYLLYAIVPPVSPKEAPSPEFEKIRSLQEAMFDAQNKAAGALAEMDGQNVLGKMRTASSVLSAKFAAEGRYAEAYGQTVLDQYLSREGVPEQTLRQLLERAGGEINTDMRAKHDHKNNISWGEAQNLVQEAYADFHPAMGAIAAKAFEEGWVHATPDLKAKFPGAFSAPGVPQRNWENGHPYVSLHFNGTVQSTMTLAHEMGHAIAQYMEGATAEKRAELGVNQTVPPNMGLHSAALHETFAHIGEKIVGSHMEKQFRGTERYEDLLHNIEAGNVNGARQAGRVSAEMELRERMAQQGHEGKLNSFSMSSIFRDNMEEVDGRYGRLNSLGSNYKDWAESKHLFQHQPYYNASYVLAEAASRVFIENLEQAPTAEAKAQMQQSLVDVMAAGNLNNGNWQQAMSAISVDVLAHDFTDRAYDYTPKRHEAEPTQKTGREAPPPSGQTPENGFLARLGAVTDKLSQEYDMPSSGEKRSHASVTPPPTPAMTREQQTSQGRG